MSNLTSDAVNAAARLCLSDSTPDIHCYEDQHVLDVLWWTDGKLCVALIPPSMVQALRADGWEILPIKAITPADSEFLRFVLLAMSMQARDVDEEEG